MLRDAYLYNRLTDAHDFVCVRLIELSHLCDGSAKYQLEALDSVDRRDGRLIGDLANKKLQSLEHRRKVACLSVFYKIYFEECAQELFDPVPPSPVYHRTARHNKDLPYPMWLIYHRRIFVSDSHRKDLECPSSFQFPQLSNMSTFKS
ncbi:jg11590 [Pararge aegeria aegeria]|uniref:Jg11590 protein n=1 Tax=Pararge aegeria aegeria TaxID=348720 RepID=A0A8S4RTP4_9NEOP|nr:jg11590 [Pararge aegeria aegeria]